MKALLRKWGDKYYVWMPVTWKDFNYCIVDENGYSTEIYPTNILAVDEDNRAGYVVCANCNKLIKNDPESIEAHYAEEEAKKDCFKCGYLRTSNRQVVGATGKKNDDGTYTVTQNFVANLSCSTNYWGKPIDSRDADEHCIYRKCRRSGMAPIDDIFVKYPGVFEKLIAVDTLIEKKCEYKGQCNGSFEYDLKMRGTLFAEVNEMGVVDRFRLSYRGHSYYLYYSDKHDIMFYAERGYYKEGVPYGVPSKKIEQVKEIVAKLYKEANK